MIEDARKTAQAAAAATMPIGIKLGLAVALVLLVSGGMLLYSVRGEALLIDLYAAARLLLCF